MAHISTQELADVLSKSGLPLNNSVDMRNSQLTAPDAIRAGMGQNQESDAYYGEYKKKLAAIADLDSKLGAIYSDPNSNLYIRDAGARQNIVSGAENTEYKNLNRLQQAKTQSDTSFEDKANQAFSFYKLLTTTVAKEEKRAKSGAGGTSSSDLKQLKALKAQAEYGLTDEIGITDPVAKKIFLSAPDDYQRSFIQTVWENGDIPDGGFSADDITTDILAFKKNIKSKSTPKVSTKPSLLDALNKEEGASAKVKK